jgi:hypothetical protein
MDFSFYFESYVLFSVRVGGDRAFLTINLGDLSVRCTLRCDFNAIILVPSELNP